METTYENDDTLQRDIQRIFSNIQWLERFIPSTHSSSQQQSISAAKTDSKCISQNVVLQNKNKAGSKPTSHNEVLQNKNNNANQEPRINEDDSEEKFDVTHLESRHNTNTVTQHNKRFRTDTTIHENVSSTPHDQVSLQNNHNCATISNHHTACPVTHIHTNKIVPMSNVPFDTKCPQICCRTQSETTTIASTRVNTKSSVVATSSVVQAQQINSSNVPRLANVSVNSNPSFHASNLTQTIPSVAVPTDETQNATIQTSRTNRSATAPSYTRNNSTTHDTAWKFPSVKELLEMEEEEEEERIPTCSAMHLSAMQLSTTNSCVSTTVSNINGNTCSNVSDLYCIRHHTEIMQQVAKRAREADEYKCVICLGTMIRSTLAIAIPCLHKAHYKCIRKWFRVAQRVPACPLCTTPVNHLVYKIQSSNQVTVRSYNIISSQNTTTQSVTSTARSSLHCSSRILVQESAPRTIMIESNSIYPVTHDISKKSKTKLNAFRHNDTISASDDTLTEVSGVIPRAIVTIRRVRSSNTVTNSSIINTPWADQSYSTEISCTVEETNRIRRLMGMRPLQ